MLTITQEQVEHVRKKCQWVVRDPHTAEDTAGYVLWRVAKYMNTHPELDGTIPNSTVSMILQRGVIDFWRSWTKRGKSDELLEPIDEATERVALIQHPADVPLIKELEGIIAKVDIKNTMARVLAGYSQAEIARQDNQLQSTVNLRMNRIREKALIEIGSKKHLRGLLN